MKILQVINSLGTGGAEKLLLETIPMYNAMGIQVDVLLLWDNDHPFAKELRKTNSCKIFILNESDNLKDIYKFSNIGKIRGILKNYDIAHVHLFPAQYFVSIANLGLTKKLIFTEHSTSNKRIQSKFFSFFDKFIYRAYKKIVSISDDVTSVLKSHISNRMDDIIKIENGVNLGKIHLSKVYCKSDIDIQLVENDILICQVSAFRLGKDQLTLVRALQYLPENYKLILVGDGDQLEIEKVKNLIEKLELSSRVKFLGNRMDIGSIVKSVDYNVLSSQWEGLSLSSIEGMASGKPFIASDVPGLRDIVKEAGVLFPLGDAEAFARIILHLQNDESFYDTVVKQCIERAENYNITNMVQKHIDLYKEVYAKG